MQLLQILFAILIVVGSPGSGGAAETPTDTVKKLIEAVRSFKQETPELSAQDKAANAKAREVAEQVLSLPELSQKVLGAEWKKLKSTDQKDFVALIQNLLQKIAYPKSAEFFSDLNIAYENEQITGAQAIVETSVTHPEEGQITIEYKLYQKGGKWIIDDVLLDGVSLVANVRSQMQQVIAKESYQGLVKRIREKLAES